MYFRVSQTQLLQQHKKMTSVAGTSSSVDLSLQTINEDVARILLENLQNYWRGLLALSLTCKQWRARVNSFVDKRLRNIAPNTEVHSIAQRNKLYEEFSEVMQNVSEIRMVALNEALPTKYDPVGVFPIPWLTDIVIFMYDNLFVVVNITDGSVIHRETGCLFGFTLRYGEPVSFNEHSRTFAIQMSYPNNQIVIRLYSLNGMQVQLINTTSTNLDTDRVRTLVLSDDGTLWSEQFHCIKFTTAVNVPEFTNVCAIKSNSTKDGTLIYYCLDEEPTIKCYDTATRKSWTYLTHPRLVPNSVGSYPRITFHPDCDTIQIGDDDTVLFVVADGKITYFMAADNIDYFELSPDRSKFFYVDVYAREMTVYSTHSNAAEYIQTMSEEQFFDEKSRKNELLCHEMASINVADRYGPNKEKLRNPAFHGFKWLNNDEIIAFGEDAIVVIDVNEPQQDNLRGIKLPMNFQIRSRPSSNAINERTVLIYVENPANNLLALLQIVLKPAQKKRQ